MMKIAAGKAGEFEVDESRFNDAVRRYLMHHGLQRVMERCHASVTKTTNPKDYEAVSRAVAEKKLASMYAGETGQARAGGGKRVDEVQKEIVAIAVKYVTARLAKAGKSYAKLEKEQKEKLLAHAIGANEAAWRAQAEETVAARRASVADADDDGLLELLDDDGDDTEEDETEE